MLALLGKIFSTPHTVIPIDAFAKEADVCVVGKKIEAKVRKLFRGSLAIREVAAGSSNAEEQEITALNNSYYDIERFGVHFVASPRHADMLFVTGPVTRNMAEAVRLTYEAMPDPKIVVAVGDGAIDGGVFRGSYGVVDSLSDIIPVHFSIPGDPPSPATMLAALLRILERIEQKRS